ncbi:MAG: glycosyltransferase family 2 protein, partial [Ignavibacteria bacterium]|nr:glycosyltransferase family 2 protein [Ignavibacteria bacterium]
KELELRLLKHGYVIQYVPDAIVYDEKVQNVKVFSQQRRRWISAQFHYFGKHFIPATKALLKHGNIEYFNKAVQYIQLPRVLLLGILFILSLSSTLFDIPIYPIYWVGGLISIIVALLLAVPRRFYNLGTLKSILILPIGFLFMFISLLNIRGANRKFIHTKHTYNAFQIKKRKQG